MTHGRAFLTVARLSLLAGAVLFVGCVAGCFEHLLAPPDDPRHAEVQQAARLAAAETVNLISAGRVALTGEPDPRPDRTAAIREAAAEGAAQAVKQATAGAVAGAAVAGPPGAAVGAAIGGLGGLVTTVGTIAAMLKASKREQAEREARHRAELDAQWKEAQAEALGRMNP